jgi:hypothetical protein
MIKIHVLCMPSKRNTDLERVSAFRSRLHGLFVGENISRLKDLVKAAAFGGGGSTGYVRRDKNGCEQYEERCDISVLGILRAKLLLHFLRSI